jgi:hypothetical protein
MSQVLHADPYRLSEVMTEFGVSSERTIGAWELACPYLDGEPFTPTKKTVVVSQENQWGAFEREYQVKVWAPELVESVKRRQQEVKAGRYVHPDGKARISSAVAVGKLRKIRPKFNPGNLLVIARKGCRACPGVTITPFRPGFLESPKSLWWIEQEIDDLANALRRADQGVFGSKWKPSLARHAVLKRFGYGSRQLRDWAEDCLFHPAGKLTPDRLKGGRGHKRGQLPVWTLRDLVIIRRNRRKPFEGVYPQAGQDRRLNLTRVALEFPTLTRCTWERCVEATEFHPSGKLPTEPRPRPTPPYGEELTVLESDALLILENIKRDLETAGPPPGWKTARQLMARHKVTEQGDRIKFVVLLRHLRDAGLLQPQKFLVQVAGRAKRRLVNHYDVNHFAQYLDGCTVADALAKVQATIAEEGGRPSAESRAARMIPTGRSARMGPPTKPQTTELYLFCFEERQKGEPLSAILKLAHTVFGARSPQTEAEVSTYIARWRKLPEQEKCKRIEQLKEWKIQHKNGG